MEKTQLVCIDLTAFLLFDCVVGRIRERSTPIFAHLVLIKKNRKKKRSNFLFINNVLKKIVPKILMRNKIFSEHPTNLKFLVVMNQYFKF